MLLTVNGDRSFGYLCLLASLYISNFLWSVHSTFSTDSLMKSMDLVDVKLQSSMRPPGRAFGGLQAFVISSHQYKVDQFLVRNQVSLFPPNSSNLSVAWFPASNGLDQVVLDEYAHLTGFPVLNASRHYRDRSGYSTPHHTGCFMSHWNLLRLAKAGWETLQITPKALLVFEEDATCAASTISTVTEIIPTLPLDWDMLYIGGKPFSYHTLDPIGIHLRQTKKDIQKDFTRQEFRTVACHGGFGRTSTGPFAPDGGRNLSLDQPYWQTHYITNTHAYIVNPQRIDNILHVLEHPTQDYQVPVDIAFADAAQNGFLKVFMSTMEFCVQQTRGQSKKKHQSQRPRIWQGLYYHRDLTGRRIDDIFFSECPRKA